MEAEDGGRAGKDIDSDDDEMRNPTTSARGEEEGARRVGALVHRPLAEVPLVNLSLC